MSSQPNPSISPLILTITSTTDVISAKSQHLTSHSDYLKENGALLKPLLHDFMKSILLMRPSNVYEYASEYFQEMPASLMTEGELDSSMDDENAHNDLANASDKSQTTGEGSQLQSQSPTTTVNRLPTFKPLNVDDTLTDLIPISPSSKSSHKEESHAKMVSNRQEAFDLLGLDDMKTCRRQEGDVFDDSIPFYENMRADDVEVLISSFLGSDKKESLRNAIPYIFIDEFKGILFEDLDQMYGRSASCRALVTFAIDMTLPLIAESDALYHDVDLVIQKVLMAASVIRGLSMKEPGINVKFWTHIVVAILCGYVSMCVGSLEDDVPDSNLYTTTRPNEPLKHKPPGSTDAVLLRYRLERSRQFIDEKFCNSDTVDRALLKTLVSSTCFPFSFAPPKEFFLSDTFADLSPRELSMCKLVLGCDSLIHLASENSYNRLPRMYHELREADLMGPFEERGIHTMPEFRKAFHKLFWKHSLAHIRHILSHLSITQTGQAWRSQLFGNLFECFYGFLVPDSFSKKHFTKWTASLT
eukprot:CAMPEP_0117447204 /NCGR_PEP_ID=MMETSP0759-20121206/6750_1 /TAXON_ID=63605 /ORGANISM="Percolomonas cosmopolitus, Strain WS" /LENGTH=528 /DNA_ID=CAMNT_0005239523 /DNA_START=39 /DNA_END=1625 /DNA_ORIENTATION=-